ncbi:NADPH dehydrogenase NamA [Mucilaginibacter ginkgonis]|uniref:NADPH dehydrogenase NamA n=1 Tax=Mucilaginibacter ginkgonis TaxID=2682091 RepID=A0A6I4I0G1_9SPHI|nr:NADPH dehydrogenase NamA [Mucilaginibacter ginkgonis]QQL48599.1 NADPH dehydrogenase NamA [Mucilaginibacter ginkgonis]
MSQLFSPLQIKNLQLKNRLVVSPMCEYSSEDGFATDWHLVHLGSRAVGGAALVLTEAIAVSPEGRISYADLGIYKDEHIEKLKQIVDFVHEQGAYIGTQLAHAGRKGSTHKPWDGGKQIPSDQPNGWKTVGPSAIPFTPEQEPPLELDITGIDKVIADFKAAALRSHEAGFDVIELHAAHGYLINQFLSPLSNQRADNYGGSFENRIRLLIEIIDAIKEVWPEDKTIFVRISATEWTDGGWTDDDSVSLAKVLNERGVDLIDCSTGGNVAGAKIPLSPGYQVQFAEKVKQEAGILTGAVGLITESNQAEEIIRSGRADLIFMARELLRDPYFPLRAAHELGTETQWPKQYERAQWK